MDANGERTNSLKSMIINLNQLAQTFEAADCIISLIIIVIENGGNERHEECGYPNGARRNQANCLIVNLWFVLFLLIMLVVRMLMVGWEWSKRFECQQHRIMASFINSYLAKSWFIYSLPMGNSNINRQWCSFLFFQRSKIWKQCQHKHTNWMVAFSQQPVGKHWRAKINIIGLMNRHSNRIFWQKNQALKMPVTRWDQSNVRTKNSVWYCKANISFVLANDHDDNDHDNDDYFKGNKFQNRLCCWLAVLWTNIQDFGSAMVPIHLGFLPWLCHANQLNISHSRTNTLNDWEAKHMNGTHTLTRRHTNFTYRTDCWNKCHQDRSHYNGPDRQHTTASSSRLETGRIMAENAATSMVYGRENYFIIVQGIFPSLPAYIRRHHQ